MTTTRDPYDVLTAARPSDERLHEAWTPTRAESVLAEVRQRAAGPGAVVVRTLRARRATRRWAATGVAAAVAALGVLAASAVLTPQAAMPKAQAIEALATAAAQAPTLAIGPGQYLHQVVTFRQDHRDAQTPAVDSTSESWVDAGGTTWLRAVSRTDPVGTSYSRVPASKLGPDPFMGTQPSDYERWPTDATALRAFFDAHIRSDGPNALDPSQSIFEDCTDRFVAGTTPPKLNAALIRLLGSLPQVTTSRVQFAGRAAVRLEYRGAYVDAVYFDERTAQYLGETDSGNRTEVTALPTVVDAVPAEVRARATTDPSSTDTAESVTGG